MVDNNIESGNFSPTSSSKDVQAVLSQALQTISLYQQEKPNISLFPGGITKISFKIAIGGDNSFEFEVSGPEAHKILKNDISP